MSNAPLPTFGAALAQELDSVESLLRATTTSEHRLLADAAGFLIAAGGKRFRPAVVIAASKIGDADSNLIVTCAAAIELMHLATLYHDDVMDETDLRRGVDTAHRRYGNARAILVGDYLFARASGLAADLGAYVARKLADTIAALVDGQILETEIAVETARAARVPTVQEHLEVLRLKTGALIASSAHLGAYLSGCEDDVVQAATRYGEAVGLAFQLADDLLDITADAADSGKVPGTDLREGVLTLPAIATLSGEADGALALQESLAREGWDEALDLLRNNGSIDVAKTYIDEQRRIASQALAELPSGLGRDLLTDLAGSAVERKV